MNTTQILKVDSISEGWHSGIKFLQQIKISIKMINKKHGAISVKYNN